MRTVTTQGVNVVISFIKGSIFYIVNNILSSIIKRTSFLRKNRMFITLTPGANVINIRKPVFRKKLVRFVEKLKILLIIKNVPAFYEKGCTNFY